MKLHEYIKKQVNECIDELQAEQLFRDLRPIIAESLEEASKELSKYKKKKKQVTVTYLVNKLMKNKKFRSKAEEYLKKRKKYDGWADNLNGKTYSALDNLSDGAKRRIVTQRLKDKKIDCAPLAYKLWPDMTEDAARSKFYKCMDGRDGFEFTKNEVAQLYQMLNNKM